MSQELIQVDVSPSGITISEVEKYARNHGFKSRSEFIRYLIEKEMLGFKTKLRDIVTYISLLLLFIIIFILLMVN